MKNVLSSGLSIKTTSEVSLMIVHTRSDHLINIIPCLPSDRVSEGTHATDIIWKLIHDNPDSIVVEHIHRLRSESAVRTSILEWLNHETRGNYVMFVDMSHNKAVDQGKINFQTIGCDISKLTFSTCFQLTIFECK